MHLIVKDLDTCTLNNFALKAYISQDMHEVLLLTIEVSKFSDARKHCRTLLKI